MAIKIRNLSFSYQEKEIIKEVDLDLPDCGLFVLLGKSGSGKSTFLSLLIGTLKPTSGTIEGCDKENTSIVFQQPLLLDYLNVEDNVGLSARLNGIDDKPKISEVLEKVGLNPDSYLNRNINCLSGGEKMRVSLARALMMKSDVILLDEPTGQLDLENTLCILDLIKELSKEHLMILVTHDVTNSMGYADFVYELKDKKINELKSSDKETSEEIGSEEKEKHHFGFRDALLLDFSYIRTKRKRVIFSSLFMSINLFLVLFCLCFKNDFSSFTAALVKQQYAYETFYISEKNRIISGEHLSIEQHIMPSKDILDSLNLKTYDDLRFFLPESNEININKKSKSALFQPVLRQEGNRLSTGNTMKSSHEAIVNSNLLKEFDLNEKNALGKTIAFHHYVSVSIDDSANPINIRFDYEFRIVGISVEKTFLNQATVYYDYESIHNDLMSKTITSGSGENQVSYSIGELFESDEYMNEDFRNHALVGYSDDIDGLIEKSKSNDSITISSNSMYLKSSITQLVNSIIDVSEVFMFINIVLSIVLESLIVFSLKDENIRFYALAKVFAVNDVKKKIMLSSALIQTMTIACPFVAINVIVRTSTNLILKSNKYPTLFNGMGLSNSVLITAAVFLISVLISILSIRRLKDNDLKKELEGED